MSNFGMKWFQTDRRMIQSAVLGSMLWLVGCASQVVTPAHLNERTAFALGARPGSFVISGRVDDAVSTRYHVQLQDGRAFNCTIGGSFSVTGPVVTDAICHPVGGAIAAPASPAGACNELLRAAGRC